MESRRWMFFVFMSMFLADSISQDYREYEWYNFTHAESSATVYFNEQRSTLRNSQMLGNNTFPDITQGLSSTKEEQHSETLPTVNLSGLEDITTQTSYFNYSRTEAEENTNKATMQVATETYEREDQITPHPEANSIHIEVTNSSVVSSESYSSDFTNSPFTTEVTASSLLYTREGNTLNSEVKSIVHSSDVSLFESTHRSTNSDENIEPINYSPDNPYNVTSSELSAESTESSIQNVSEFNEISANHIKSTVSLNDITASDTSSETYAYYNSSIPVANISTIHQGSSIFPSPNSSEPLNYTVNNEGSMSSVDGNVFVTLQQPSTTESILMSVECNHTLDCQQNEVCLLLHDSKRYCSCDQNFFRDNVTGHCSEDPSYFNEQLRGITTFVPSSSAVTSREVTSTLSSSVSFFENFTVTDQVGSVGDGTPTAHSNQSSTEIDQEETSRGITLKLFESRPNITHQDDLMLRSESVSYTTEEIQNLSSYAQEEHTNNHIISDATQRMQSESISTKIFSTTLSELYFSTAPPHNENLTGFLNSEEDSPNHKDRHKLEKQFNHSSEIQQSKNFQLMSWNNLTNVEQSANVLSLQIISTLDMVEWFHAYDYPFRKFIANILAKEDIKEGTQMPMIGAKNVVYIAPTPLTDGQTISICFIVASENVPELHLNASEVLQLILKERSTFDKEVHLQISSASIGCPSKYREKYVKCKMASVPPLAVAISIIIAMVVLVLILIVLLYARRHRDHRGSYKPNLAHRKWCDARYCQTGQDLSSDLQCTEGEHGNHLNGGKGNVKTVPASTNTNNMGEHCTIVKESETENEEEFIIVHHCNKMIGNETDYESKTEDTKI